MIGRQMLDTKIPPPIIAILIGVCIYFSRGWLPQFESDYLFYAGLGCELLAVVINLTAIFSFIKNKTTINPVKLHTVTSLVTTGVFAFSRNPMYLGLLLFLFGFALQVNVVGGIPLLLLFVLYINRFQIIPEERALAEKFGDEFQEYSKKVRRWI